MKILKCNEAIVSTKQAWNKERTQRREHEIAKKMKHKLTELRKEVNEK